MLICSCWALNSEMHYEMENKLIWNSSPINFYKSVEGHIISTSWQKLILGSTSWNILILPIKLLLNLKVHGHQILWEEVELNLQSLYSVLSLLCSLLIKEFKKIIHLGRRMWAVQVGLLLLEWLLLVVSLKKVDSCSLYFDFEGLYLKHSNISDLHGQMCDRRAVVSRGIHKSCRGIREGNGMFFMKVRSSLIFVSPTLGVVDVCELWM